MLYGDTLEEYIHIELIGVPLIKAAKETPSLVLVRTPVLLRLRPFIAHPVVLIRREQTSVISDVAEDQRVIKPITVSAHREFSSEATAAQALLAQLIQRRDLLEPFERLQVALSEAHQRRIGDNPVGSGRA
jgi:hypothetical protein